MTATNIRSGVCASVLALVAIGAAGGTAEAAALELQVDGAPGPFTAGSLITIELSMRDLKGEEAAGFQAFLSYDSKAMTFILGEYTDDPFGQPILAITGVDGELDLAAGLLLDGSQSPTSADATLAVLTFQANVDGICIPDVAFRDTFPPSRLTSVAGEAIKPLDLDEFPLPACAADLDFSGDVGIVDLLTVLASWGAECPGDVNRDGLVGFTDLLTLLSAWGPCP